MRILRNGNNVYRWTICPPFYHKITVSCQYFNFWPLILFIYHAATAFRSLVKSPYRTAVYKIKENTRCRPKLLNFQAKWTNYDLTRQIRMGQPFQETLKTCLTSRTNFLPYRNLDAYMRVFPSGEWVCHPKEYNSMNPGDFILPWRWLVLKHVEVIYVRPL